MKQPVQKVNIHINEIDGIGFHFASYTNPNGQSFTFQLIYDYHNHQTSSFYQEYTFSINGKNQGQWYSFFISSSSMIGDHIERVGVFKSGGPGFFNIDAFNIELPGPSPVIYGP